MVPSQLAGAAGVRRVSPDAPDSGAAGRHPARQGGGKLRLKAERVRRLFARSTLLLRARYFSWSLFSAKSPMCTLMGHKKEALLGLCTVCAAVGLSALLSGHCVLSGCQATVRLSR